MMLYIMNKIWLRYYRPGHGPWDARLNYRCAFIIIKCLNSVGLNSSLLNLMCMAIENLMAITQSLHYPAIMKTKKIVFLISGLWVLAIVMGFSDFFSGIHIYHKYKSVYNYCEFIWLTQYHDEYLIFGLTFLCLVVMMVIYIKIYVKIHQRHEEHTSLTNQSPRQNRRPLITTLLILGSFVICWLPMCFFQVSLIIVGKVSPGTLKTFTPSLQNADQYLYDLLLLNCIIDPIVYAVRMPDIRLGYRRMFGKCGIHCCCNDSQANRNNQIVRRPAREDVPDERFRDRLVILDTPL